MAFFRDLVYKLVIDPIADVVSDINKEINNGPDDPEQFGPEPIQFSPPQEVKQPPLRLWDDNLSPMSENEPDDQT
jgi:hypothetical protein